MARHRNQAFLTGRPFSPKQLRIFRLESGFTQRDLARMAGVSAATVTRWEGGEIEPTPYYVRLLSRLLACDVDDLRGPADGN